MSSMAGRCSKHLTDAIQKTLLTTELDIVARKEIDRKLYLSYFDSFCTAPPLLKRTNNLRMKTTPKNTAPLIESLSYEESLHELENIISTMEAGQMPLQEALDTYKRGIFLLRHCQATLTDAEQQIHILEDNSLKALTPEFQESLKESG
ncbi:MAG: exodeoxyribonuclease VII small subunit [Rugosibacter sp.]